MKDIILHENVWWWGHTYTFIANDGKAMIELAIDETNGNDYFGTIQSLLVHESARHRGRANALLFQAEQYARQLGLEQVVLCCRKGTWLVGWYERRGYKIYDDKSEYSNGQTVAMQKIFEDMPPKVER